MFPALYQLWPFVAFFFLVDCLVLVGAENVLFWALTRRGLADRAFRRVAGGVRLLPPWPGIRALRLAGPELVPTEEGLYVRRAGGAGVARLDPACYDCVAWRDVGQAEADHHWLHLPGIRRLRLPAPAHARALEKRLRTRAGMVGGKAEPLAAPERAQAEVDALKRQLRSIDRYLRRTRWSSWLSFGLIGVALPIALYPLHNPRLSSAIATLGAIALVVTAVAAVRAVRRIGRAGLAETTGVLFPLLLSPPNLLRAGDALALDLAQGVDPHTAAAHLLAPPLALPHLRRRFHEAAYAAERDAGSGWQQWWRAEGERVMALALACGLEETQIRCAPALEDPSATGFCPHCRGEYRGEASECESCRLPLVPTASPHG